MILKNNIDFLTFNDGVAKIYETDENDDIIADSLKKYRFGNEKNRCNSVLRSETK